MDLRHRRGNKQSRDVAPASDDPRGHQHLRRRPRPGLVIDPGPATRRTWSRPRRGGRARGGIGGILLTHSHRDHTARRRRCSALAVRSCRRRAPLTAIPTPGHAADHVSFVLGGVLLLRRPDPRLGLHDRAAAAWAARSPTTWTRCAAAAALDARAVRPGHGPLITDPAAKIAEYLRPPRERERAARRGARGGRALARTLLDAAWGDVPGPCGPRRRWRCRPTGEARGRGPPARGIADAEHDSPRCADAPKLFRGPAGAARRLGRVCGRRPRAALAAPAPPAAADRGRRSRSRPRRRRRDQPRPLGRAARRAPHRARPLVRPGLLPRPGPPLAARPLPAGGRGARCRRSPGPTGLPSDRFMRTLGLRRAAPREEAELDAAAARATSRRTAPGSTRRPRPPRALPIELQLLRLEFEPWRPADSLPLHEAAGVRPLDELGARAPARRHGPRARPRARGACSTPGTRRATRSCSTPGERLRRRRARARGADRRDPRTTLGFAARGHRLEQLGGRPPSARPLAAPLIAGDPHLPPGDAGDHLPAGPAARRPLLPRRVAARHCPGSPSARTTTSPGRLPTPWPTCMDLFVERVDGDRYEFEGEWRGRWRVSRRRSRSGASEPGAARGPRDAPRPDRQRGARRRRLRAAGADLGRRSRSPAMSDGQPRRPRRHAAAPSWSSRWPLTRPRSRTCLGRPRTARSATRRSGRIPMRRGGCPDLPQPGWTRRVRVGRLDPLRRACPR